MSDQDASWPTGPKHSRLGIASFVTSITAVVLLALALVIATTLPDDLVEGSPEAFKLAIAAIFSFGFAFMAFAFGIAALFQKEKKKLLAVLGMVFSSSVIAVTLLILLFGSIVA